MSVDEILLVEDNPTDAELTMKAIVRTPPTRRVHHAQDIEQAWAYLFPKGKPTRKPKVIFLDVKLPKISGLEILSRLRQEQATRFIPIVMLTSSGEPHDMQESYERGANAYVVKPVEYKELLGAISQTVLFWTDINRHPPS